MRDSNENWPGVGGVRAEIGRAVSILVALACLVIAYFLRSGEVFHLAITVVVLPLGCIWYGNEIGGFVGMTTTGEDGVGNVVGALITVVGWVVLFAMLAAIVYYAVGGSP